MNDFNPDRNYYKPIDKKTNLVKRCVGLPGDSLEIRDGYIYINAERIKLPSRAKVQYNFFVDTGGIRISQTTLKKSYGAREGLKYPNGNFALTKKGGYILTLTDIEADRILENSTVKGVTKLITPKGVDGEVFPHITSLGWNADNFGPIFIPKKGTTIELNLTSFPFYKRIIQEYENNDLEVHGNEILINGQRADKYTFKQDYYWMMGDNRQNSIDACAWGYVPFDHVVGKPVFIWFSWEKQAKNLMEKIRWNRLFTTVKGNKEPKSYFFYFLTVLLVFFGIKEFIKRKKR